MIISVLLPNYNHSRSLQKSVESVLSQTYQDFEILLTDDGSGDGSQDLILELSKLDRRIKPFYFRENRGALEAVKNSLYNSTGQIVLAHSADDYLVNNNFFANAVESLRVHPCAGGFYGVTQTRLSNSKKLVQPMGSAPRSGYLTADEFRRAFLNSKVFVPGNSSLWRRNLISEMGGYNPALGPKADFFINHAIPSIHGVIFDPTVFAESTKWEDRSSYSSSVSLHEVSNQLDLLEVNFERAIPAYRSLDKTWAAWKQKNLIDHFRASDDLERHFENIRIRLQYLLPKGQYRIVNSLARLIVRPILDKLYLIRGNYRRATEKISKSVVFPCKKP